MFGGSKTTTTTRSKTLHEACASANLEEIREFLSLDARLINSIDEESGQTPLMAAVVNNASMEVVQFLVENDADIAWKNKARQSAFDMVVKSEKYDLAKYLVDVKPDILDQHPDKGWILLSQALAKNDDEFISVLSSKGFPFPTFTYQCKSAECLAEFKNIFDRILKEKGITHPLVRYQKKHRVDPYFGDRDVYYVEIAYDAAEANLLFPNLIKKYQSLIYSSNRYTEQDLKKETNILIERFSQIDENSLPQKNTGALTFDNEREFIDACLGKNRGLCLGECHQQTSVKLFLIDNMSHFKQLGVSTLYFEHLMNIQQDTLDEYILESPIEAPMPERLALYLSWLDKICKLAGKEGTLTNVVRAAKQHGIRIVAIDTAATNDTLARSGTDGHDRIRTMNMIMLDRFGQYDDGEKYIIFIGGQHAVSFDEKKTITSTSYSHIKLSEVNVHFIGVSQLLGCPSILIHDAKLDYAEQKFIADYDHHQKSENVYFKFDYGYFRPDLSQLRRNDMALILTHLNSTKKFLDHRSGTVFEDWHASWNIILAAIRTVAVNKMPGDNLQQLILDTAEKYKPGFFNDLSATSSKDYYSHLYKIAKSFSQAPDQVELICKKMLDEGCLDLLEIKKTAAIKRDPNQSGWGK